MDSPKTMAENVELIIITVKDATAVKEISFGKNGTIEGKNSKLIVADMSTIDPVESKKIAKEFEQYQIKKLEIPVMGGPNVAISGKLVMMVSGDKESFEQCRNIFEKIGLFDIEFFAYVEDTDFGWRALMQDISSFFVPNVIVFHKGSPNTAWSSKKFYLLESHIQIGLKMAGV